MRKIAVFAVFNFCTLSFFSCSAQRIYTISAKQLEEYKPHGPLFWIEPKGTYKGAIPCKDCPGIEVTLVFKADNTVKKSMRYIQSGGRIQHVSGTWLVEAGNIVRITYPGSTPKEYYKAQSGGHLIALSSEKQPIEDKSGQFNIFNQD